MLRLLSLLFVSLFLAACSNDVSDSEASAQTPATETATTPAPAPTSEPAQNGTLLCEINGNPWHYTKASGIITADRKTGARTALITFKKKLDKGSESIQLYYDAATNEIQRVSMQLKFPKAGGGLHTSYYDFSNESLIKKLPGSSMEGSIDLSDPNVAAGTAAFNKVSIKYEAEQLDNPEDAVVSVTDLRFSGVGYSDLVKEKAKLGL